jgi:hypothetical protein
MIRPRALAVPDSTSSLVIALARYFRGRGLPLAGLPGFLRPLFPLFNLLPVRVRQAGYGWVGWLGGVPAERLHRVSGEAMARWATRTYTGPRRYSAVVIGSSNGAMIHLCAALGIPWLPQTFLTIVRQRGRSPDDIAQAVERSIAPGRRLLDANPDLALYQLHDPIHDRPVLTHAAYFRSKRLVLGPAYESFILERIEPGGTIVLVDCERRWPSTAIGPRHFFQLGGAGSVTPEEYRRGSERVERFLAAHGSDRRRWEPPAHEADRIESEWGFDPVLGDDVARFASRHGYRLVRLAFEEPEHLSPPVADFQRELLRERGLPGDRLVGALFFLLDPWWTARTGSVPWWSLFNTESSARCLEEYLDGAEPYDEIRLMLLSNLVEAVGLAPPAEWERIAARARRTGGLLGVTAREFPNDLATIGRYQRALKRIPSRHPVPAPVPLSRFQRFLGARGGYRVTWHERGDGR